MLQSMALDGQAQPLRRAVGGDHEPRLTVVIPAFNERGRLPPTLARIADHLIRQRHWLPSELIVVDDGSVDDTAEAARNTELPQGVTLDVVVHRRNRGKGAAVRTGLGHSSGRDVLLCDADLAAPIEELEVLRTAAARDRVVFGSRALDRALIEIRQPVYRDLMGRTFNLAVRTLVLPGVHDTQCGFKLFPGGLGRALAAVQHLDGFAFDVELLMVARRWGFELHEIAIRWCHVEASRVQPLRHSTEMLRDLMALWLRRLTGRLPPRPPRLQGPAP